MRCRLDIESELRECAALLCEEGIALEKREFLRKKINRLAFQVRSLESPYLTVAAAARRYHIDAKDFRKAIEEGDVEVAYIAGRRRIDIRQFDSELI